MVITVIVRCFPMVQRVHSADVIQVGQDRVVLIETIDVNVHWILCVSALFIANRSASVLNRKPVLDVCCIRCVSTIPVAMEVNVFPREFPLSLFDGLFRKDQ